MSSRSVDKGLGTWVWSSEEGPGEVNLGVVGIETALKATTLDEMAEAASADGEHEGLCPGQGSGRGRAIETEKEQAGRQAESRCLQERGGTGRVTDRVIGEKLALCPSAYPGLACAGHTVGHSPTLWL